MTFTAGGSQGPPAFFARLTYPFEKSLLGSNIEIKSMNRIRNQVTEPQK